MFVGQAPGKVEQRVGKPFQGPAGHQLDLVIEEAGLSRAQIYITNTVRQRPDDGGKDRKPTYAEMMACRPWLDAELEAVGPRVVVALGATAARAVLGRTVKISDLRGHVLEEPDPPVVVTTHPSAVLRLRGRDGYDEAFAGLVSDLRLAAPYA